MAMYPVYPQHAGPPPSYEHGQGGGSAAHDYRPPDYRPPDYAHGRSAAAYGSPPPPGYGYAPPPPAYGNGSYPPYGPPESAYGKGSYPPPDYAHGRGSAAYGNPPPPGYEHARGPYGYGYGPPPPAYGHGSYPAYGPPESAYGKGSYPSPAQGHPVYGHAVSGHGGYGYPAGGYADHRGPPPPPIKEGPSSRRDRSRSPRSGHTGQPGKGKIFKRHHSSVPKNTDLKNTFGPEGNAPSTTGMLRNIPNKYNQEELLEEIDKEGFEDTYDFFYLPMDVINKSNVGYAFINFKSPGDLQRFTAHFNQYSFQRIGSKKKATVSPATVQGLKKNVQNLMKRKVAQGQFRPLVIMNGKRVELEEAAGLAAEYEMESDAGPVAAISDHARQAD